MEFKGTIGNFRTKYVQGHIRIVDENENNVIDTPWKHLNESNAKLIASAPEMFEMLKVARDKFLDLKYDNSIPELQEIQSDIEQLLTKITE